MAKITMPQIDLLRHAFPASAQDLKLNLSTIAGSDYLDSEQVWGVALASAYFIGEAKLLAALLGDAKTSGVRDSVVEDAQAAASLMAMNTVYYRFRHLIGKDSYKSKSPRLRMSWMARPKNGKTTFELMCLAVAVLEGCEMCVKSHEASILQGGLTEEHVHDAVRIAAILKGSAVALGHG